MRNRLASWTIGALALLVAGTAFAADPVRIDVKSPEIRRGQVIDLACAWEHPVDLFISGRFQVWCKLVDPEGRTLAFVRRPLTISLSQSEAPEYRFRLRMRVPRSVNGAVRVDVLVHDGTDLSLSDYAQDGVEAEGSIPLFENAGRGRYARYERFVPTGEKSWTWTGKLVRAGVEPGFPVVDVGPALNGGEFTVPLYGKAAALVMRNPAWEGASVSVTGTPLMWGGFVFDYAPQVMYAESVTWQDPVAQYIEVPSNPYPLAVGALHSRIPPADLLANPLSWRALLRTTREPRIVTDAAGRDALVADLRPALAELGDPLAPVEEADMAQFDLVCLFTGATPNHGYRLLMTDLTRDDRTQTTYVSSIVIGPGSNAAQPPEMSDAFAVYLVPKLPGTIRVLREEWLPDRPAWW